MKILNIIATPFIFCWSWLTNLLFRDDVNCSVPVAKEIHINRGGYLDTSRGLRYGEPRRSSDPLPGESSADCLERLHPDPLG